MKPTKVAVILPSRGLIFSRTAEEILNNVKGIPHKFFFAHKLPIPECFEEPTRAALSDDSITHLWFVEDDMIIPPNTLKSLLEEDVSVISCDYPVSKDGQGSVFRDGGGNVIFTGTGCMLVRKYVFSEIGKPYFRTDVKWWIKNYGDHIRLTTSKSKSDIEEYGLHDVTFGAKLFKLGIPINISPIKCGQRKLIALGKAGTNNGAHKIEEWHKIKKDYYLKKVMSNPPEEQGDLVTITGEGGEYRTDKDFAEKLIKKGLATKVVHRYTVIDDEAELL